MRNPVRGLRASCRPCGRDWSTALARVRGWTDGRDRDLDGDHQSRLSRCGHVLSTVMRQVAFRQVKATAWVLQEVLGTSGVHITIGALSAEHRVHHTPRRDFHRPFVSEADRRAQVDGSSTSPRVAVPEIKCEFPAASRVVHRVRFIHSTASRQGPVRRHAKRCGGGATPSSQRLSWTKWGGPWYALVPVHGGT